MSKATKDTRIRKEKKRLLEIFRDLDANKLAVVDALIARAAYITVSLQDLEEQIDAEGWTEGYKNGENQHGLKKSAAAEVHISLTKNLNAIMKQLIDLTPAASRRSKLEELMGP